MSECVSIVENTCVSVCVFECVSTVESVCTKVLDRQVCGSDLVLSSRHKGEQLISTLGLTFWGLRQNFL